MLSPSDECTGTREADGREDRGLMGASETPSSSPALLAVHPTDRPLWSLLSSRSSESSVCISCLGGCGAVGRGESAAGGCCLSGSVVCEWQELLALGLLSADTTVGRRWLRGAMRVPCGHARLDERRQQWARGAGTRASSDQLSSHSPQQQTIMVVCAPSEVTCASTGLGMMRQQEVAGQRHAPC